MRAEKIREQFPIVGIGASAGGIKSFEKFLAALPGNSGMAFILVQHLAPLHKSILPEILAKITTIPVHEITDSYHIKPNHIYVIPENKMLKIIDHELKLLPRKKNAQNMPIDFFFSSLAKSHQNMAIGVVLSGTAHDGTIGLRNIKKHGGISFAEDPKTATWDGMPKSAIEAGVVDFVLPVEEIPAKLIKVHPVHKTTGNLTNSKQSDERDEDEDGLKKILSLVKQHSKVDFSHYKAPAIIRRIDRRMAINHITSHRDYLELLRENKSEQDALLQDLLIKGSAFYRDPELFEKLSNTVFPQLLANQKSNKPIRIWVSACSTGEEAYSLAIAFFDVLGGLTTGQNTHHKKIQIFATDISETAISKARSGIYTAAELEALSPRQREAYFTKIDGSYKVIKAIRDTIVFAVHSFIKDPPFSNVDLVSCRNVLIYFDLFLQEKVLTALHYGLNENGFLLLGKSETIGSLSNLFIPFSKQDKIFMRKPGSGRFVQTFNQHREKNKVIPIKKIPMENHSKIGFKANAEAILVSKYTPSSVVVDEHLEIVHVNGNVAPFLAPSSGKPTHELLKMARKELVFELRNAMQKAKTTQESVTKEGIPVMYNGERFSASIEIVPLTKTLEPHYLILFQKKLPSTSFWDRVLKKWKTNFASSEKDHLKQRNSSLENELEQIREDMRHISQEQEAFNEELQSANEELLSSNEEMQSLNEELETSKEELQSTNEELIIVNHELLEKQGEVNFTLNYLEAIIANLREPLLVLEKDFRVQIANASFYKNFDLDRTQIEGMAFFKMQDQFWDNDGLRTLLHKVLPEKKRVVDEEIVFAFPSGEKRSFMLNAREIVRETDSEKLILLSMEDVTERKKTESYKKLIAQLEQTNEQLDKYVHVASHDLQEPLRKIMIFSDLLLSNQDDELAKYRGTLEKIATSALRMSGLIKSLLDYSRVAHHGDLYESTDLNQILKEIIFDFEVLINEKQAQITIDELPEIEAIPLQMTQLLTNLLANALKFSTKEVAPIITVSSRPLPQKDIEKHPDLQEDLDYFEITISDNGIGISPQYHQQVFEIFQRLQNSKDYDGSGIGLSLVKRIVQNHHGTIFMVSEEREGAAFHVILPKTRPK